MAGLVKQLLNPRILSRQQSLLVQAVRAGGYWNKDWKPGPYPKTEEERIAAARKYGLRPDEYEPYPDDGVGYGDYPKLPIVSGDHRDPYEDFDYPELRRNFMEPMHVDFDIYGQDRINENLKMYPTVNQHVAFFFTIMGIFIGLFWFFEMPQNQRVLGIMPKQMPYRGETHYTFEPVE